VGTSHGRRARASPVPMAPARRRIELAPDAPRRARRRRLVGGETVQHAWAACLAEVREGDEVAALTAHATHVRVAPPAWISKPIFVPLARNSCATRAR
jgi:hypothetical protein